MSINFNSICSNIIPAGTYKAVVTDAKFRMSATGEASKDIVVTYTIAEGPMAKRTLMDTIYEKAFSFRLRPFLQACKVDMNREFASAEDLFQYGLKEAKGKTLTIEIGVRAYNGRDYNDVKSWSPLAGSTVSVEDVLKDFGDVSEPKADAVKEQAEEPILTDINITEDELPF
jgi:hypothetical protein